MVVPLQLGRVSEARQTRRTRRWLRSRVATVYKLRVVEEADRSPEPGEVGRLLRREGLSSFAPDGVAQGSAHGVPSSPVQETRPQS